MAAPLLFQSLGTRIAVLTCFWLALLLSIPSWLRLTTIQRLPLPTRQVEALQLSEKCPVTFGASLSVLVDPSILPQDVDGAEGRAGFLGEVELLVQQSLQLKAELPAAASLECTQWNVSVQSIASAARADSIDPETGRYVLRVLSEASSSDNDDAAANDIPAVYLPAIEDPSSLPLVPDTISAAVIAELLRLRGDKPSNAQDDASIADTEQDPRVIQYSKHVRLVFSIMNQDVTDGTAYDSWLIHTLASDNATASNDPVSRLTRELSSLHDFHVETQVQWFAPLHFQPTHEVLEEVVESEVEQHGMVDQEVEEEVEVEVEVPADEEAEPSTGDADEAEVEQQLASAPAPPSKRTKLVKQIRKRTIQVPRLQRVVQQTRTPLPPRHVVEWDDLKVFVNSQEWSLTSTVPPPSPSPSRTNTTLPSEDAGRAYDVLAQTHDLHFLLYIPSRSHSPLMIRDPVSGGVHEASNAWLIPQWGGVVILNAEQENGKDGLVDLSRAEQRQVQSLPQQPVLEAIATFARQLEILLGLPDTSSTPSTHTALQRRLNLAALHKRRILELTRETTATLLAITRLVNRIDNLGVGAHVKSDIQSALSLLQALANAPSTSLEHTLQRAKEAHALSNRAFFNPDMLGLLYFPDEHKYAVYTPLFAPLLVPLFVTSVKLLKEVVGKGRGGRGKRQATKARKSA
ncbi:related to GPI transamidase component PIG-S [Sporisorium reilianum f. sp. reilianum]|uniref:Related to GPI transamidase component PIG-S n=1 Tax=Sporisorium reilianum f. sp. reilianum TaxID=72559 RepID=A0A2N8U9D0_9BASI|nr:related to GPI transamidase component PIG-S [Sporisorium reilianum f. sp. reilianum]